MLSPQELQLARERARQRYEAVGIVIVRGAGAQKIEYFENHGRGRANAATKHVKICRPTTKRRLFTAAHEAGHLIHNHKRQKRSYLQEYEATQYAIERLHDFEISIPRKIINGYKRYVVRKIDMGLRRGGSEETLDSRVLKWCGKYWEAYIESGYSVSAVYRLKNQERSRHR